MGSVARNSGKTDKRGTNGMNAGNRDYDKRLVRRILDIFEDINSVPRGTHNLEKIHPWIMDWGRSHGLEIRTDKANNIVMDVPATPGHESGPIVVLQGHMDMVCEKRPGSEHDFSRDPIVSWQDGDWLRARETSLGADNGIALAMMFELITDSKAVHPRLELLITTDEESGLVGAQNMSAELLKGRVLINLDSEDEGVLTIGCAGGEDVNLRFPVERETGGNKEYVAQVRVGGLEGGHSGTEIHAGKASANVVLLRVLRELIDACPGLRLGDIGGGTAHNAIAREARATCSVPGSHVAELGLLVAELQSEISAEYEGVERGLKIVLEESESPGYGFMTAQSGSRLVDALRLVPHGVIAMSTMLEGAVSTSINFSGLKSDEGSVSALTNRRSTSVSPGRDVTKRMESLARLYGASVEIGFQYPSWEPVQDSDILERCKKVWKELQGTGPKVEVTHAGLECGAIGGKYPGMDMISMGPTIRQPHSPDERLHIPSLARVQEFLKAVLASYVREA